MKIYRRCVAVMQLCDLRTRPMGNQTIDKPLKKRAAMILCCMLCTAAQLCITLFMQTICCYLTERKISFPAIVNVQSQRWCSINISSLLFSMNSFGYFHKIVCFNARLNKFHWSYVQKASSDSEHLIPLLYFTL